MHHVLKGFVIGVLLSVSLALPLSAYAAIGVPFGGRTTFTFPCLNGGLYEIVAGLYGGAFIWTPASLTYAQYQIRPAVSQLGIADAPYGCIVGFTPAGVPIVWPGLRIQMVGTSLVI